MKNRIIIILCFITSSLIACSQNNLLADSFYFKGDFQHAIPYYKKALGDTSTSALLWQRLAYSNFNTGNLNEALAEYQKSLSLKPNPVLSNIIYTNVLLIYDKQNKHDEAIEFLQHAADNGFNNLALIDTTTIFKSSKSDTAFITAYNKIRSNAYPCLSQPHGNDFNFWIGEWDVYITGTSNLIGKSVITKVNGGCTIVENWTSLVSPQTGISINFIDAQTGKWMQDYVGSGGGRQLYVNGEYKDIAMRFTYEGMFNNTSYPGHFIFYNEGANQVRQLQDYSNDGGKTFVTAYEYTYKRKLIHKNIDSFILIKNSKIYYHQSGNAKPAIVFVSGFGEDHNTWQVVQDSLSNYTLTLSYDRAGLGKSDYNNESKDLHALADELKTLVDADNIPKPFVLTGHSLGCQIIKEYAALYPNDVKALVFIDPGFDERKLQAAEPDSVWQKRQQTLKKYLPAFNKAQQKELDDLNIDCAAADSITALPKIPTILFTATLINPDFPGSAVELKVKKATHELWLKSLPWATHVEVSTSRHYIQNDDPDIIIKYILSLL